MRALLATLFLLTAGPAWAACEGRDLMDAIAPAARAQVTAAAAAQPYPDGILFRATRGAQQIDLVGTMHFYEPRHERTYRQIRPWIEAADTVFLELGEGDEARLQAEITANPGLAFIIDGPTLPDLLSPEDWARLRAGMRARGMPGFMAAKMRPWMAMMTLSLSKCVIEDVRAGKAGLDKQVMTYAAQIGKPAQALEDYDTAFKIFESFGQDEMLGFLSLFLRFEGFSPEDQYKTLVESYFREEIRAIWEFGIYQGLAQPQGLTDAQIRADYARMEDALIGARNRGWMERILPAAEEGRVLVAAGALHMPGDQGLLALLEGAGFAIERIALQ